MLFTQTIKARFIPSLTVILAVVIFMLCTTLTKIEVMAAEQIRDSELANLYGAHVLYWDAYCRLGGSNCPYNTPCPEDDPIALCRFCLPRNGEVCDWRVSTKNDPTCSVEELRDCSNAAPGPPDYTNLGFCNWLVCYPTQYPMGKHPNCNEHSYSYCRD